MAKLQEVEAWLTEAAELGAKTGDEIRALKDQCAAAVTTIATLSTQIESLETELEKAGGEVPAAISSRVADLLVTLRANDSLIQDQPADQTGAKT